MFQCYFSVSKIFLIRNGSEFHSQVVAYDNVLLCNCCWDTDKQNQTQVFSTKIRTSIFNNYKSDLTFQRRVWNPFKHLCSTSMCFKHASAFHENSLQYGYPSLRPTLINWKLKWKPFAAIRTRFCYIRMFLKIIIWIESPKNTQLQFVMQNMIICNKDAPLCNTSV